MDLNMDQCTHDIEVISADDRRVSRVWTISLCYKFNVAFNSGNVWQFYHHLRFQSLSSPASRILLLSVSAADLGVGLFVRPGNAAIMVRILSFRNFHGGVGNRDLYLMCTLIKIWQFLSVSFAGASLLTVGAICTDEILALYLHLRYQQIVTASRVVAVVSVIWVTAFLTALLQTLTVFNYIINLTGESVTGTHNGFICLYHDLQNCSSP